jgi:FkbM family methyltransferase
MISTLRYIAGHPLNRGRVLPAWGRFIGWQMVSRMRPEVEVPWIDGAKLIVRRGMTGATGNIYCGLHEFADMALLLHLLGPGDSFVDAGANIGSYTILAAKICGARVDAFEPDPGTAAALRRNIAANDVEALVTVHEAALGEAPGSIRFTVGLDTTNHIVADGEPGRDVPMMRLDDLGLSPTFMKFDLEGFEGPAFRAARATLAQPSLIALVTELADAEITALMTEHGFVRRHYDPMTRTLGEAERASANALFVRDPAAVEARVAVAPQRCVNGATF